MPATALAHDRKSFTKSSGKAEHPDDIVTWVHFKYVYHDSLPGWAITYHEAAFYSGQFLSSKYYVLDGGSIDSKEGFAWHSMPVTRADMAAHKATNMLFGDGPCSYAHLMPSRIIEIDWKLKGAT